MQWLRRSFIAGFFVTVPLVISVAAFVWIFRLIDGFVGPFYARWLQETSLPALVPGWQGEGLGILTTALLVLVVAVAVAPAYAQRAVDAARGAPGQPGTARTQANADASAGTVNIQHDGTPIAGTPAPDNFARFQRDPEIGSAPAHGVAAAHS